MTTGTAAVAPGCLEQPLLMPCGGDTLLGILSTPGADATAAPALADLAVLVVVGGPQYRAGSHRLFVHLCRHLAGQGIAALRFDVRGMGDSTGAQRSFEHLSDDIAAALHALQQAQPAVKRVVLWGLCDGASAALLYLQERPDPRVQGLCLLNPWVRSEATLARTHVKHYYLQRLRQPEFWRKLISGQVAGQALRDLLRSLQLARQAAPAGAAYGQAAASARQESVLPFSQRMALGLKRSHARSLIVLSGQDYTAREFEDHARGDALWLTLLQRPNVRIEVLPEADHTISANDSKRQLLQWTERLLS